MYVVHILQSAVYSSAFTLYSSQVPLKSMKADSISNLEFEYMITNYWNLQRDQTSFQLCFFFGIEMMSALGVPWLQKESSSKHLTRCQVQSRDPVTKAFLI